MKKIVLLFGLVITVILVGCSPLGEVNNSLNYADKATSYLDKITQFSENVPQLVQDAATNPEARKNLEDELKNMKTEIKSFNETKAPVIAKDIHSQLVKYNEKLDKEIDSSLNSIKNGKYDPAQLQNTEMMKTINKLTSLKNKIENLGS